MESPVGIALGNFSKPPVVPSKVVVIENELNNSWLVTAVAGGILLLYSLSRLIALQRRVRDLESRPPVDDIVMRGMIRQEVSDMLKVAKASAEQPSAEPSMHPALVQQKQQQQQQQQQQRGPLGMNGIKKVNPVEVVAEKTVTESQAQVSNTPAELGGELPTLLTVQTEASLTEAPLKSEEDSHQESKKEIETASPASNVTTERAKKKSKKTIKL